MNILLVYPWYAYASVTTFEEPLGVLYLASSLLKAGHSVEVADLTFQKKLDGLKEKIGWADVAGISAPTPLFGAAALLRDHIQSIRPDIPTLIGGPHATADPADALQPGFDVAVIGEGDSTVVELVEALRQRGPLDGVTGIAYRQDGKVQTTPPRPFISDLDDIPFPARQFIDYSRYRRMGLIAMRGCPYRCLFCKPLEDKLFGKRLRKRSLENIVEEIHEMVIRYGNRTMSFKDDTLTVNETEWFERLGEELERLGGRLNWQCSSRVDTVDLHKLKAMKKAGCRQIFFGMESGSQRILDYYRKDTTVERIKETFALCRRVGIRACASVMLGAPPETREDLEETYQLIRTIKPFNWHVHITTPICGTFLHEQATSEGRLAPGKDYRSFEPTGNVYRLHLPMRLDHVSAEDVAEFRDRINRYMKFRLLLKCLVDPRIWAEFLSSRGLRTVAFHFIRRHFNLLDRFASTRRLARFRKGLDGEAGFGSSCRPDI